MFEKILIAEDFDSTHLAIKTIAKELNIPIITQAYYCDDALFKIQKAFKEKAPYQLLITDLSFIENYNHLINTGEELIQAVKKEFPKTKIIVFSVTERQRKIQELIHDYHIDAYVIKSRRDTKELKNAIREVYAGKKYFPKVEDNIITEYDINLVRLLQYNYNIEDISKHLKKNKITPYGKTYIYERISLLKNALNVSSIGELIFEVNKRGYLD